MDNTAPLFSQQVSEQTGLYVDMGMMLEGISFSNLQRWYSSLYKVLGVVYSPTECIPYFYELVYNECFSMDGMEMITPLCLKIQHPSLETSLLNLNAVQRFHHDVRSTESSIFVDSTVHVGMAHMCPMISDQIGNIDLASQKSFIEAGGLGQNFDKKGDIVYDYKTPNEVYTDLQDFMYLQSRDERLVSPFEDTVRYDGLNGCPPDVLRRILYKFSKEPVLTSLQKFDAIGRHLIGSVPITTDYPVHRIEAENYPCELIPQIGYVNDFWSIGNLGKEIPFTDYHVSFKTSAINYRAPVYEMQWEYGFDRFERDYSEFDFRSFFTKQLDGLLELWNYYVYNSPSEATLWITIRKTFGEEIVVLFYCAETEETVGFYYDDILNYLVSLGCIGEYS